MLKIGDKEYTDKELATLAKAGVLNIGQKNDPASTTLPGAQLHGPLGSGTGYGPLSGAGIRPEMYSAFQRPPSLARALPIMRSEVASEMIEIMTGVTDEGGTNATGFCGDPPSPGALKICKQVYTFGDYYVKTDLNAAANVGLLKNRADVPRQFLNDGAEMHPLIPDEMFNPLTDTRSQLAYELWKIGVGVERSLSHVIIQGDTTLASTATEWGWISEFAGLDGQIKTGYTDAHTGNTCPAADSDVHSFNANIDGTDANSDDIVTVISDQYYGIRHRADHVGMNGVQWALVMRQEAFYALTEVWACNYYTARCTATTNAAQSQDATRIEMLRQEMIGGSYLLIDGVRVPVLFDEGIPQETLGDGYYKSDFYLVPLNWMGRPLTYLQYFPMDNQYSVEFTDGLGLSEVRRMNNGLWLVGKRDTGLCIEYHFQAKMRLILDTPFLAGRVDDVWYYYRAPSRNAIPGASLYVDGGTSYLTS